LTKDLLIFRDDGKTSYSSNPRILGVKYCKHCRAWHEKLALEGGPKFCAFCYTTHHSKACRSGFGDKCSDPELDPIHEFLVDECSRHQKFDLSFCKDCNCFHSKRGWKICLRANPPKDGWDDKRKLIWRMRWEICTSDIEDSIMSKERSLFDLGELTRITPHVFPFSNGKFVHHRKG
jgi:hypothetical protein